jgi:hypothetical protein
MTRFIWIVAIMTSLGMAAEPVRIESRHIDRKLPGCGNEKEGCAHVEFTWVEVAGGPAAARQRINAGIAAFVANSPDITPEAYAQQFIDGSASAREELPPGVPYVTRRWVKVLRTAPPVFSLECNAYDYTSGGVHGLYGTEYLNFDPVTGERVKLASILKDGAMAQLTAIAEVHFRGEQQLAATAKLEDKGFTFPGGRFALNDNYGFGEKALLFLFNPYEIGPYFMGATLVEIPYTEIRDLIRPGFPL